MSPGNRFAYQPPFYMLVLGALAACIGCAAAAFAAGEHASADHVHFTVEASRSGAWSDPETWKPARVPRAGDRVLIGRGKSVRYDSASDEVIRLIQVAGKLHFARDRNTLLNVGLLKVQNSEHCSESGFACDISGVNETGEPVLAPGETLPTFEIGTRDEPIPPEHTAIVRLHYLEGMNPQDAPAVTCCAGRMELHGAPLNRTWVKLGADTSIGSTTVVLSEPVTGWRVGDEVIVTGSRRLERRGSYRNQPDRVATERRRIAELDGVTIVLDRPLDHDHWGTGAFRSEVANLSRNVVVESADPGGVRGHTMYHRFSQGGISYARFAHLGKEGVLGRYAIHFHLVGDTMRGSSVLGAAIVDSHNRWVTIHGTQYLLVRDCVGFESVGHGFFLEDGTEVYNLLDHNLGVHAYRGRRLPKQVMPFDPNDGGAFWWANARNSLVRNVACENDEYGFRYDSQKRSNFDSNLLVPMPDGREQRVDIRTLPVYRFEANEAHTEGLYGFALAGTDGVGPDVQHPHIVRNLKIWQVHYALRTQLPTMLVEDVTIHQAAYGIYRPWFENHVYRNLYIGQTNTEPFNRGLDDESLQHGIITIDGLSFAGVRHGGNMPLIQISDNNASGKAESHFRNVRVVDRTDRRQRPLVNLGGGPRNDPRTVGVPVYLHDWYGSGRHAKVVSTRAKDLLADGSTYRRDEPLTGDESLVAEVTDVPFPQLLDPIDDLPPATIVTSTRRHGDRLTVRGVSHDNGQVSSVTVNGREARTLNYECGVMDWEIDIDVPADGKIVAAATDAAGNVEQTPHVVRRE